MLQQDAKNCVDFYIHKQKVLESELECRSVQSDQFSTGAMALLTELLHRTSHLLQESTKTLDIISSQIYQHGFNDSYGVLSDSSDAYSEDSLETELSIL